MNIDNLTPNKTILKELGDRLSRVRKQQKLSQEQLAVEAGIGVATLRRIEDGQDSQLRSWLKLLKTLQMIHVIENLLPESFNSPMAEVLGKEKRTRANKQIQDGGGDMPWGDEESL